MLGRWSCERMRNFVQHNVMEQLNARHACNEIDRNRDEATRVVAFATAFLCSIAVELPARESVLDQLLLGVLGNGIALGFPSNDGVLTQVHVAFGRSVFVDPILKVVALRKSLLDFLGLGRFDLLLVLSRLLTNPVS
jgi:hypothetical protein